MAWVHVVLLLALAEYFAFGLLVGNARAKYQVKAPAVTGDARFERYFRVQQNTLEVLIIFVPALLIAAQYWDPVWIAALGAVYVVGRLVYLRSYVRDPASRSLGYSLSIVPALLLVFAGAIGAIRSLL
jgi:glutathione S-transferase